jgi:hypothetical protein
MPDTNMNHSDTFHRFYLPHFFKPKEDEPFFDKDKSLSHCRFIGLEQNEELNIGENGGKERTKAKTLIV